MKNEPGRARFLGELAARHAAITGELAALYRDEARLAPSIDEVSLVRRLTVLRGRWRGSARAAEKRGDHVRAKHLRAAASELDRVLDDAAKAARKRNS